MDSKQIIAQADGSLMPTYAHFNAAIVSGKGATLTGADGRTYIDFTSGIGVNALGYGDPDWVRAISDQAARLQHISNLYYAPPTAAFAEKSPSARDLSVSFCAIPARRPTSARSRRRANTPMTIAGQAIPP